MTIRHDRGGLKRIVRMDEQWSGARSCAGSFPRCEADVGNVLLRLMGAVSGGPSSVTGVTDPPGKALQYDRAG